MRLALGQILILWALGQLVPTTAFPSEHQMRSELHVGMTRQEVINKFGLPFQELKTLNGLMLLLYVAPPTTKEETAAYGGFEVYLKGGMVTDVEIILDTTRNPK